MTFRTFVLSTAALTAFGLVTLAPVGPSAAQSSDNAALLDRLERLERDIRTLNIQIARGGAAGASSASGDAGAGSGNDPAYARISVRLSELETSLRSLTGRIEEINFSVNQMSQRVDKMATDFDFRLRQLEQGGAASGASSPMTSAQPSAPQTASAAQPQAGAKPAPGVLGTMPAGNTGAASPTATPSASAPASEGDALLAQLTGEPLPAAESNQPSATAGQRSGAATETASAPATPRDQYLQAFGLLRQGKYDEASVALNKFIGDHPNDKLTSNARYWLGETHYVKGAFVDAAETFLEGYQSDPQGPKAPDALLKLGMSLSSLDKKTEACAAFQKLKSDYPSAPAGLKATLQREWQKNGCV